MYFTTVFTKQKALTNCRWKSVVFLKMCEIQSSVIRTSSSHDCMRIHTDALWGCVTRWNRLLYNQLYLICYFTFQRMHLFIKGSMNFNFRYSDPRATCVRARARTHTHTHTITSPLTLWNFLLGWTQHCRHELQSPPSPEFILIECGPRHLE